MIVQSAPAGEARLVIRQTDHAKLAGQFAEAFGNREFAPPEPAEPCLFVAAHHDEGWRPVDEQVLQDPATGLPYHLPQTPMALILQTNAGSPEFNGYYHPYSGLLSSMHTTGLYNGRYGMSDRVTINLIPAEHRPAVEAMLAAEQERQARLKAEMAGSPLQLACEEVVLFHNYKLLQFFDLLALYFNLEHDGARRDSSFEHVPRDVGEDATIAIRRLEPRRYALHPYPFRESPMSFSYVGRLMSPQPPGSDLRELFESTEPISEELTLIRG